MSNVYLNHYEENKISPVRQDLSNLDKHFYIRKRLYQQLGILPLSVKDKNILEIGAGGGFNSLVTASFIPKKYTIIEPNSTAIQHMNELFSTYQINMNIIDIQNKMFEDFEGSNYDLIIAEGFLPAIDNKYDILKKIESMLNPGGILVITTADEVSLFFEIVRRFLANMILKDYSHLSFESQMYKMVNVFGTHLDTLNGMTRLKYDWCCDNLRGNATYTHHFSPKDALEFLKDGYFFYNMSPSILLDDTWFKDVALNSVHFNEHKINNFEKIWHNLIHYQVFSQERSRERNLELKYLCTVFNTLARKSEHEIFNDNLKNEFLNSIKSIKDNLEGVSDRISNALDELMWIVEKERFGENDIKNLQHLNSAFGRGQQYMSFVKKEKNSNGK